MFCFLSCNNYFETYIILSTRVPDSEFIFAYLNDHIALCICALFFLIKAPCTLKPGQYLEVASVQYLLSKNVAISLFLQKRTCPCINVACSEAPYHPKWHNPNNHAHSSSPIFITTCTCGCFFHPFFGTDASPYSCFPPQRKLGRRILAIAKVAQKQNMTDKAT